VQPPAALDGPTAVAAALLTLLPTGSPLGEQLAAWATVVRDYLRCWGLAHAPAALVLPRGSCWRGALLIRDGLWSLVRAAQVYEPCRPTPSVLPSSS
jgi:hypothetical protein